jgi:hypothetical protein
MEFNRELYYVAANGRVTGYYPYSISLGIEECWDVVRNSPLDFNRGLQLSIQTLWHFWYLHEIS